jgi:F-type H+-transporting ATPase subunit delta
MDIGAISTRYAKALLGFAQDQGTEDAVYKEMQTLSQSFFDMPDIKSVFDNPLITLEKKAKVLIIAAGGDEISQTTKDFIHFVMQKKKESFMFFISMSYQRLYRKSKNIISAEIVSAQELNDKAIAEIISIIKKNFKGEKSVLLDKKVDESLIGGFVLTIEKNKRLNLSIAGELQALKRDLKLVEIS